MTEGQQPHGDSGARMSVDTELVAVRLSEASFAYMVEMLNQMPHAKAYHAVEFDPAAQDLAQVVRDFVAESEPRGALEAEPLTILDATAAADGSYLVRADARLAASLSRAGVPDAVRAD